MAPWAALRNGILAIVKAMVRSPSCRYGFLHDLPAYALTALWLAGVGMVVGLTVQRAVAAEKPAATSEARDGVKPDARDSKSGMSSFGELEIERLGLAAATAITRPAGEGEGESSRPPEKADPEALQALAKLLGPIVEKHHGDLWGHEDHVTVRFPLVAPSRKAKPVTEAALVEDLAPVLAHAGRCSIQLQLPPEQAGKRKRGAAAGQTPEQRRADLKTVLHSLSLDAVELSATVAPPAREGNQQTATTAEAALVLDMFPPRTAHHEAK
jgi:hypothetical protein